MSVLSNYKKLRLTDIKKLNSGDKIHIAQYLYGVSKLNRYIFTFSYLEKASSKYRGVKYFIHGNSSYTDNMPLWVSNNGDVKFARSTDESPAHLIKIVKSGKSSPPKRTSASKRKSASKRRNFSSKRKSVSKRRSFSSKRKSVSKRRSSSSKRKSVSKRKSSLKRRPLRASVSKKKR